MQEILQTLSLLMQKGVKVSEFLSDGMPVLLQLGRDLGLNSDDVLKLFMYVLLPPCFVVFAYVPQKDYGRQTGDK